LHLHPSWQRLVVPTLARAFPNLQFVLTSHSPLVAGTFHARNTILVEAGDQGVSQVKLPRGPIHGLTADQLLISPYFGLDTTRAPDAERKLLELSERLSPDDAEASLAALRELTDGSEALAEEN
jgi:hypothetical protein